MTFFDCTSVVKEEIIDDDAHLPCFNGRVVSWVRFINVFFQSRDTTPDLYKMPNITLILYMQCFLWLNIHLVSLTYSYLLFLQDRVKHFFSLVYITWYLIYCDIYCDSWYQLKVAMSRMVHLSVQTLWRIAKPSMTVWIMRLLDMVTEELHLFHTMTH